MAQTASGGRMMATIKCEIFAGGQTMDEVDVKIILALADNKMNVSKVSRVLFYHRNAVEYRIKHIKRITGLDPTDFHGLCKLVDMVGDRQ
jgi:sugar diacid utilization regulator